MSSNSLPEFQDLILHNYPRVHGFYILGLLQTLRPDVKWVTPDQWTNYQDCTWLCDVIDGALKNQQAVALVVWDEAVLAHPTSNLGAVLNRYKDQPVWLVTQLDTGDYFIYQKQFDLRCKIIDLPWLLLNDTLTYYAVSLRQPVRESDSPKHNYLCMLGRYDLHKFELARALRQRGLNQHGLITVSDADAYPPDNREFCQVNPNPPQDAVSSDALPGLRAGARNRHGDIWISGNVKNYLYLEQTYTDIPLIVHPDTTWGIFQNTEKVLWPLLLGRLMLVFGRPRVMAAVQKWYDLDFAEYADLTFDNYSGDWSIDAHTYRLDLLLDRNKDLICNASGVFARLKEKLESARWTIGRNLYEYFVTGVDKIHAHT